MAKESQTAITALSANPIKQPPSLSLSSVSPASSFRDAYFTRSLIPLLHPFNYASPCWHSSLKGATLGYFPEAFIDNNEKYNFTDERKQSSCATNLRFFYLRKYVSRFAIAHSSRESIR